MKKYPDFWSVLLGNGPHGFFLGYLVVAYIAACGMVMILASTRDVSSPNTPATWSWKFFWANNMLRFIAGFLLIPIFIRLIYQYAEPGWMLLVSIGIGFGFQYLAHLAKNIGLLTTDKISARIAEALKQKEIEKQNTKH